jgi:phage gpG-like protein
MALDFQVSIRGVAETAHEIEQIGYRAVHARSAMVKILGLLLAAERRLWARSGGKKWPPRAPSTQERDPGGSLMVHSGHLKASLTQPTAEDAIREATDVLMDFGTRDYVARFHQAGTKDGRLPKREVLVFRPTDKRTAREIIAAHLVGHELGAE